MVSEIIRDGQVQQGVSISLWAVNVTVSPTTTFVSSGAHREEKHMAHWFLEDTHSHAHTQLQFVSRAHASLHTETQTLPHEQTRQHTGHVIVFWSKRTTLYVCMFSAVQSMWHHQPTKKFNIWKPDDFKVRSYWLISMIGSFTPVRLSLFLLLITLTPFAAAASQHPRYVVVWICSLCRILLTAQIHFRASLNIRA